MFSVFGINQVVKLELVQMQIYYFNQHINVYYG